MVFSFARKYMCLLKRASVVVQPCLERIYFFFFFLPLVEERKKKREKEVGLSWAGDVLGEKISVLLCVSDSWNRVSGVEWLEEGE